MNKYMKSILILFVFIFLYDWLVHGYILQSFYQLNNSLWRSEAQMQEYVPWLLGGHFLSAFFSCLLMSRSDSSSQNDFVVFGMLIGLLAAGAQVTMYAVAPYPLALTFAWIVFEIVKFSLVGLLFYYINR